MLRVGVFFCLCILVEMLLAFPPISMMLDVIYRLDYMEVFILKEYNILPNVFLTFVEKMKLFLFNFWCVMFISLCV